MKVLSARIKWSPASELDLFWTPLDTKSGALGMDIKDDASKGKKLKSRLSLYLDIARPLYNSQRKCCINVNVAITLLDTIK